jgi:hypothetical protein
MGVHDMAKTEQKKPWEAPKDLLPTTTTPVKDVVDEDSPEDKEDESDEESIPGVRRMWTRGYVAGQIIKKYGLEAGITEELVNEIDQLFGKTNYGQSWSVATAAWHGIRGYTGQLPSDPPEPETVEEIKETVEYLEEQLAREKAKLLTASK